MAVFSLYFVCVWGTGEVTGRRSRGSRPSEARPAPTPCDHPDKCWKAIELSPERQCTRSK